jgi:hypothetical protein
LLAGQWAGVVQSLTLFGVGLILAEGVKMKSEGKSRKTGEEKL